MKSTLTTTRPDARTVWLIAAAALASCVGGAAVGCGDTGSGSEFLGQDAGSGAGSGTGEGGNLIGDDGGLGDGAIDPDAACATGSEKASLQPVAMLVMFDRSGSMNQDNKWPAASSAMTAFFQDPGTAGLKAALRFFPHDSPVSGCNNTDCNVNACTTPLVDIGLLTADPAPADAQEQALVQAIAASAPGGGQGQGTPMYAALAGAETWASSYHAAHPDEKTVVVLVTDGQPNGCDENIANIAALAAQALGVGILTYAVGLQGSSQQQMDQIAAAGGTGTGFFIGNGNAQADLLAALQAIQGKSVSCSFAMPQSSDPNKPIDPSKVNVNYTPGGGQQTTLGQVADAASCGPAGGWYYDNAANPTTITLCPATCAAVQADPNADIEILIGCATQVGSPK